MPNRRGLVVFFLVAWLVSVAAAARERLIIVGSSTVYPFAVRVAEQFADSTDHPIPEVRSTGTGEGIRLFCAGAGDEHPDIVNASRRLHRSEWRRCAGQGVDEIVEVKIGYDGIVLANARQAPFISLSLRQIFLALAKTVPHNGVLVPNPYRRWIEISLTLPAYEIRVIGPPGSSGTRDTFTRLALEAGCRSFTMTRDLENRDENANRALCRTLRDDGPYIEAGEDDALIVQRLAADPSALGIFGYSFLERNRELIKGSEIDGQEPTAAAIARGDYPLSRPLYVYLKKTRVDRVPALRQYAAELTNEWTLGPDGYLVDEGLIPLPREERRANFERARQLAVIVEQDLQPTRER